MTDGRREIMCIRGTFRIPGGDVLTPADEQAAWEISLQLREMTEYSHYASLSNDFLLALLQDTDELADLEKRQQIVDLNRALCNHIVKARAIMTPKQLADRTRAYLVELALAGFEDGRQLTRVTQPVLFRQRDTLSELTLLHCTMESERSTLLVALERITGKIGYPIGTTADCPREIECRGEK